MSAPRITLLLACALTACGPSKSPTVDAGLRVRGLLAEPARLAFTCVTPACDSAGTTVVSVMGSRRLAIKRIILLGDTNHEFTITPSEPAPFILGSGNARFTVDVRYAPQGAPSSGAVNLDVTYTDASPDETEDRVPPGELLVPLVRRLIGEPVLAVTPRALSFGAVDLGTPKTLAVRVSNQGFGNVALELADVDAGASGFLVTQPALRALVADAGTDLNITFAPATQLYVKTELLVSATSSEVEPVTVRVEGTSLSVARLALEPAGDIDFGEVPHGQSKVLAPELVNQGGRELLVYGLSLTDSTGSLSVRMPDGGTQLSLPPLGRAPLLVQLDAGVPGPVSGVISFTTNEAGHLNVQLDVTGTVTEPRVQLAPTAVDYGTVPQGWVVTKPVEIRNVGYGGLTIKNLLMVSGSSTLFTLRNVPSLPLVLERNKRVALDVEFRAQTSATFVGSLSVETNDPTTPFTEVTLKATAGSCLVGCPIANGTPSCQAGVCAVGACNPTWYDVDQLAANGCECKEPGADPGSVCSDAIAKGNFKDTDGRHDNFTGIVPSAGDEDLIRFHAEDAFELFSDSYNVNVSLSTSDPGISMCVYRYDTSSTLSECYYSNEACGRSFHKGGNAGSDDADYVIKVFRTAGSALSCTPYTVFMSNG